jgi:ribosomal protein L25 (general stress protein Ctc)
MKIGSAEIIDRLDLFSVRVGAQLFKVWTKKIIRRVFEPLILHQDLYF